MKFIIKNPTNCPHCGKSANSLDEIKKEFGLRHMGDDTIRVQSWCNFCRIHFSHRSITA